MNETQQLHILHEDWYILSRDLEVPSDYCHEKECIFLGMPQSNLMILVLDYCSESKRIYPYLRMLEDNNQISSFWFTIVRIGESKRLESFGVHVSTEKNKYSFDVLAPILQQLLTFNPKSDLAQSPCPPSQQKI